MMNSSRHSDHLYGFAFSEIGSAHIAMGNNQCEDSSLFQLLRSPKGKRYALLITADGVGSCRYAKEASNEVVEAAGSMIIQEIKEGFLPDRSMMKRAMETAEKSLICASERLKTPNTNELGTTLDIVLLDENGKVLLVHNGDGSIILLHRSGAIETTAKMNAPNGAVYTVDWLNAKNEHAWFIHESHNIACVISATDGVYDYMTYAGIGLNTNFFEKTRLLDTWKTKAQLNKRAEQLIRNMCKSQLRITNDDMTLAIAGFSRSTSIAAKRAGIQ